MYVEEITNKKSEAARSTLITISAVLPPIAIVIENYLLTLGLILASASLGFFILYFSVIRVKIKSDGIYKDFNFLPGKNKIVSSDDIVSTEIKKDENAENSSRYSSSDTVISMDIEGSVHIDTENNKVVISSENPKDLAEAVEKVGS